MAKLHSTSSDEKKSTYKFYIVNLKIRKISSEVELTPTEYSQLFREFYDAAIQGKSSRQKECVLISRVEQEIKGREPLFWGQIAEVTNINNKRWFNKAKKSLDNSFKIPDQYAANARITEYVFIPLVHRFCYQFSSANYINPYSVRKFLQNGFGTLLHGRYVVQVDVETDDSTIQRILDAQQIEKIWVKINYSNNDFSKELQEFIEDDLKSSNVGEMEIKASRKEQNSIEVNKSKILKGALLTAKSNGEAEATIVSNGKKEKIKTKFSPNRLNFITTFENRIVNLYKTVINEFRESKL
ncbi:DUF4747 family protein [Chitinophaga sp. NPDC101104]|uniref:DUF4747 family protein n=1 Tax=Chitinophaga sp. NPDC101104 TaxID=3390561 RepID=UPI003CFF37C3